MNLLSSLILVFFLLAYPAYATDTHPGGANKALQFNNNGYFGGITPVNGDCLISSGGAWIAGSCGGSGGSPGGSDTQVQYNSSGSFAGSSNFTFNSSTGTITTEAIVSNFAGILNAGAPPYNATGDGSTDDTAALQAAITALCNAASTGTVIFPTGTYKISSPLTVPATCAPLILGAGVNATRIYQTSTTAAGIVFGNTSSQHMALGGGIAAMTIDGNIAPTTNYSAGAGVAVEMASDGFILNDLLIRGWGTGITIDGSFNTFTTDTTILYNFYQGIAVGSRASYGIGAGNTFSNLNISNYGSSLGGAPEGIYIVQSGGEFWHNIDITSYNVGVHIAPGISQEVAYQFFTSVLADTSTTLGWFIDGTASGSIIDSTVCTNCWAAFNGGNGVLFQGAGIDGFRWEGGRIRENVNNGAVITSGTDISIQGSDIASNGRTTTAGTYNGVYVAGGNSNFQITGNTIGNFSSSSITQGTGIYLASGTDNNVVIHDNMSVSPAGGGVDIQNFSTGTNQSISSSNAKGLNILSGLTAATIYGGSAVGSTLTLDGTSNGSPSSAYVLVNPTQTAGGNLGVGVAAPITGLDVFSTTFPTAQYTRSTGVTTGLLGLSRFIAETTNTAANGFGPSLTFSIEDSGLTINALGSIGAVMDNSVINTGDIIFNTVTAGVSSEKMRLLYSGGLGIGNTAPSGLLSVGSSSQFSVNSSGTITAGLWNGTVIGAAYLPTATTGALGIMQVGSGLSVSAGTVSEDKLTLATKTAMGSTFFGGAR